jgi:hypothetical protein
VDVSLPSVGTRISLYIHQSMLVNQYKYPLAAAARFGFLPMDANGRP